MPLARSPSFNSPPVSLSETRGRGGLSPGGDSKVTGEADGLPGVQGHPCPRRGHAHPQPGAAEPADG